MLGIRMQRNFYHKKPKHWGSAENWWTILRFCQNFNWKLYWNLVRPNFEFLRKISKQAKLVEITKKLFANSVPKLKKKHQKYFNDKKITDKNQLLQLI